MSWKGWVKIAFHQPLVPVLPVARELITKTKWLALPKGPANDDGHHIHPTTGPSRPPSSASSARNTVHDQGSVSDSNIVAAPSPIRAWKKASSRKMHSPSPLVPGMAFTTEPQDMEEQSGGSTTSNSMSRMRTLFSRSSSRSSKTVSSMVRDQFA